MWTLHEWAAAPEPRERTPLGPGANTPRPRSQRHGAQPTRSENPHTGARRRCQQPRSCVQPAGPVLPGMPSPCVAFQGRAHTGHGSAAGRTREPTFRVKHTSGPSVRGALRCTEPAGQVWTPGGCWGSEEMSCGHWEPGGGHRRPGLARVWRPGREEGEGKPALGTTRDVVALQGRGATLWSESKWTLNFNFTKRKNPLCEEGRLLSNEHKHISNAEAQSPTSPRAHGQPLGPAARPPAPASRAQLWELLLPGEPGLHWTKNARRVFDNRVLYF